MVNLTKEIFDILRRERFAGRVGTDYGIYKSRLLLLKLPDFFLYGAGGDEIIAVDGIFLADAVKPVDRLVLGRLVPP